MSEEKSFLQSIKMEISKTFKLVPYERIAFHKILGLLKTENGKKILLQEIDKTSYIRSSAIENLCFFDSPDILQKLTQMLSTDLPENDIVLILDYIKKYGGEEQIPAVKSLIELQKEEFKSLPITTKAFAALRKIGKGNNEILEYLMALVKENEIDKNIVYHAIISLSAFNLIYPFEEILKENDEQLIYAVYQALYLLCSDLADESIAANAENKGLYTYTPEAEDKFILDIRVLLGKMTVRFDKYSNRIKAAFISVMLVCNHREFLVYVMKALTSRDQNLVKMVLFTIHSNISRLKDPDKLFRSLIALSTESEEENNLIVDIFIKYFSQKIQSRNFNILKDKLYNYIVVTLESYFETFRKDFMIPEVIEKSFPESFQRIRSFLLEKFTPELKKKIVHFLTNETPAGVKHVIVDIAKWVKYISPNQEEDLSTLLQVLYDQDKKSRENSAARLEDLRYEKRYLRNRIVRLCKIIEGLSINEASSTLVNIYNYLKKYPDADILNAAIHTLSMLNYSYMLGEIEIMLTTGMEEDQKIALNLLSLFHEQRSMNIITDYLKEHFADPTPIVKSLISILLERDIKGNVTIVELFKKIIISNDEIEIRGLSILGVGDCGFDADIDYLNELFYILDKDEPKDFVVRSIGNILSLSADVNKRNLKKYLLEYLKDPSIKVRIYSCLLLVKLGDRNALKAIRDMLVIKNKSIQREILTILGELRSVEFSFFLVSLLKDEYAISGDIIPVIRNLPEEDLLEIDGFVVNLFRKFDTTDLEMFASHQKKDEVKITGLKNEEITILSIDLFKLKPDAEYSLTELIDLNMRLKNLSSSIIDTNKGIISAITNKKIIAYFKDPLHAAKTAISISENFKRYNSTRTHSMQINIQMQLKHGYASLINEEILFFQNGFDMETRFLPFSCDILCDKAFYEKIKDSYITMPIPDIIFSGKSQLTSILEIISPLNFVETAERLLITIIKDQEESKKMHMQIEAEMKQLRKEYRPKDATSIASELEDLGEQLKNQLDAIDRYVQRRTTDRELIKNVRKMLKNTHDYYRVEISRMIIE